MGMQYSTDTKILPKTVCTVTHSSEIRIPMESAFLGIATIVP